MLARAGVPHLSDATRWQSMQFSSCRRCPCKGNSPCCAASLPLAAVAEAYCHCSTAAAATSTCACSNSVASTLAGSCCNTPPTCSAVSSRLWRTCLSVNMARNELESRVPAYTPHIVLVVVSTTRHAAFLSRIKHTRLTPPLPNSKSPQDQ